MRLATIVLVVVVAAACGGGRPKRLLDGRHAHALQSVPRSVVTAARITPRAVLGHRLDGCLLAAGTAVRPDAPVVERVGLDGESVTFVAANGTGVFACDGGVDPAGERRPPWCGAVIGERVAGRLLDPRLDVSCRDPRGRPLAYAFVEPVAGARWIGVDRDGYVELYEVLGGLPVRIATTRGIDLDNSRATFRVTHYDVGGQELSTGALEVAVAG